MATRAKTAKTKQAAPAKKVATAKPAVKAARPAQTLRKTATSAPATAAAATGKASAVSRPRGTAAKAAGTGPATKKPRVDRSLKTRPDATSAAGYVAALPDPQQRADSEAVIALMRAATGCEPVMWGSSIVGFDRYHYRYDSGREGDMALVGFSPRKAQLVLYLMPDFAGYEALLARLGKHATGKSCLYIKRLADVDRDVLEQLVRASVVEMRRRHPR